MADAEDEVVKGSEEQQAEEEVDLSSSPTPPEDSQTAAGRKGDAQERPAESVATSTQGRHLLVEPTLDQFKLRKFFVLRVKYHQRFLLTQSAPSNMSHISVSALTPGLDFYLEYFHFFNTLSSLFTIFKRHYIKFVIS